MGGGAFGNMWVGKTSSFISSDLAILSCILSFIVVNYLPFDLGFKAGRSIPGVTATIVFAQMFRLNGIVSFVTTAVEMLKDKPSSYYPIPVLGPIFYATMLGNIGAFVVVGIDGFLKNGMPWPFQNGLFCSSFFLFYTYDVTGPVGVFLRDIFSPVQSLVAIDDDRTFAIVFIGIFMLLTGMLQAPFLLGPSWSPFSAVLDILPATPSKTPEADAAPTPTTTPPPSHKKPIVTNKETQLTQSSSKTSKRKRKKNTAKDA